LVRVIGGGMGLVFKGSGFYITDYKNKSSSHHRKEPKHEKKSEAKHETKSADSVKPSGETSKKD
ncbi:MAG: zinc ribbon domain-containing protein, partial [Ignavibacteriales bacterium]|nr:zinc ribbon domain-containing protein [Ignavibacteriales bacterium]